MNFEKEDTHLEMHESFMSEAVTNSLSVFFRGFNGFEVWQLFLNKLDLISGARVS